ncbi:MAG: FAD binding domain-containing protein, partial [Candidatus Eisenbacteria bacterium]|nr:FAD binding domain-containing protein [Candidatus Eisenbacteria bacterium]
MLRLPTFRTWRPRTLEEATRIKDELGPGAAYVAGGTDLLPNMKRGQQTPSALIELRGIEALGRLHIDGDQCALGAGLTLASLAARMELAGRANALV